MGKIAMQGSLERAAGTARNVLVGLFISLAGAVCASAQDAAPSEPAQPTRHRVGVFITALHSFDLLRGTFGANLWVWSIGPDAERTLETMEFPNSNSVAVQLEGTVPRANGVVWGQRKLTGIFRTPWDLRNFPFDRHVLEILLEEGVRQESELVYEPDQMNSGYAVLEIAEGWRVRGMEFELHTAAYATSFGDPAIHEPNSRFSRLRAVLELERSNWTGFTKLTAALYAGFLICAIGCLVPVTSQTFAPRVTILAAALFAIVVNMRVASTALGSQHGLTLVDGLHVAGLLYIVAIVGVTVFVRRGVEFAERGHGDLQPLARLDHRACTVAAAFFIAANSAIMLLAAIRS